MTALKACSSRSPFASIGVMMAGMMPAKPPFSFAIGMLRAGRGSAHSEVK